MTIGVIGAGAFGTALGVTLARAGHDVALWGRGLSESARESTRLPGVAFPAIMRAASLEDAAGAPILLMALPAQVLGGFAAEHRDLLAGRQLVACSKGIELSSGRGPSGVLREAVGQALNGGSVSVLTGPSFAADIAGGLPTALTLASDARDGAALQKALSTPTLRLYLTDDLAGAELGGALKNVIAIACGAAIGAGLGDSARAAVMTRGFAEMRRLAPRFNARPETLAGLSGLGDLALTCTSDQSRNYRLGLHLGRGEGPEPGVTVEGAATAQAVATLAEREGLDLPVTRAVALLTRGEISLESALSGLMSRPLKEE